MTGDTDGEDEEDRRGRDAVGGSGRSHGRSEERNREQVICSLGLRRPAAGGEWEGLYLTSAMRKNHHEPPWQRQSRFLFFAFS